MIFKLAFVCETGSLDCATEHTMQKNHVKFCHLPAWKRPRKKSLLTQREGGTKEIHLGQVNFVHDLQRHVDFHTKILIPGKSDEDGSSLWGLKGHILTFNPCRKGLHLGVIVGLHHIVGCITPCLYIFWQINNFCAHGGEKGWNGSHSCSLAASRRLSTTVINDIFICVSQHEMCVCSYQTTLKQKCKEKILCSTNEVNNSARKCFCYHYLQWKVC